MLKKIRSRKSPATIHLKVHLHEIFWFQLIGQTNLSGLLMSHLKYFRFWFRIRRDIRIFVHTTHSQYAYNFFLRCMRRRTVPKLSKIITIFANSHYTHNFILPVDVYATNFILCIRQSCRKQIRILGMKLFSSIAFEETLLRKKMYVSNWIYY